MTDHEEEPTPSAASAHRRRAAVNAFERARVRGTPIEDDPRFLSWIDAWIAGDISMVEVRERYGQLLEARRRARRLQMPEATFLAGESSEADDVSEQEPPIDEAELMRMLDFSPSDQYEEPQEDAEPEKPQELKG